MVCALSSGVGSGVVCERKKIMSHYFSYASPTNAYYQRDAAAFGARFHRGGVLGPRVIKREGTLIRNTEGIVTINAQVIAGLDKQRSKNLSSPNADRIGDLGEIQNLHILEHELLFARKHNRHFTSISHITRQKASVEAFSSFNAEGIPPGIKTQEQFEHLYVFLGRCKNRYEYGRPATANDGVSIQVRGACSVYNRGRYTLSYGDLVRYELPSIDAQKRANDLSQIQLPDGMALNKLTATLKPVTYDDIHCVGEDGISHFIATMNRIGHDDPRFNPSTLEDMAPADALSVDIFTRESLVRNTLFNALAGWTIFNRYFSFDANGDLQAERRGDTAAEKALEMKKVRAVATAFGLLRNNEFSPTVATAESDNRLTAHIFHEIVLLANRGLIRNRDLFLSTRLFDAQLVVRDSAEDRLEKQLSSMSKTSQRAYALMMDIIHSRIVGKVISAQSFAGEVVDLDLAP